LQHKSHAPASHLAALSGGPACAASGQLLGGCYRVLDELGRGGMGVVYRVQHAGSGQLLALKQLLAAETPSMAERMLALFEREFYVLAQLAHPRVIAVYDYGLDPAGPFYTMELLDGGDLKALAPLPVARACALMLEVCSSLALLHSRRLVHRDVTPRNIRCTHDGHAKLIDFGAMVPMGPCPHVVGTPAFIAPEVVHGLSLDPRTDLFSLGATLYYALTGRAPFAARELSELREAWSRELIPPSRLVEGIPPALDALCASLLRIDPAQRPRSAFEVVHRLQAIAGVEQTEPLDVSKAYLATPALVGREAALRTFRQRMRRALHGVGGALRFESAAGLGRSRVLDACVLEAKTLGATVLRAHVSGDAETPFAVAQQLAEQLLATQPAAAQAAAEAAGVSSALFAEPRAAASGPAPLKKLTDPARDRLALQTALTQWLLRVCDTHALLIAVDDVPRIDEASIALLAGLALQAKERPLFVAVTVDRAAIEQAAPAYSVLVRHSASVNLEPLSHAQSAALFASTFGNVPHLPALADRIHKIARGNPRASLALAQHLVDTGVIRHEDGHWTLPAELESRDLPQSVAEMLLARVAALPALARHFVEAQALLVARALRRRDYAALAPGCDGRQLDAALDALISSELLQSDGEFYQLAHSAVADTLRAQLDAARKRELHLALCAFYERRPGMHPYLIVQHLFAAGRDAQALDTLASSADLLASNDNAALLRIDSKSLAALLLHALDLTISLRRPAREAHELRRRLCIVSAAADDALFGQVAPALFAQLERDSGLSDYRALDPALDVKERLQRALATAAARYAATPESERVYRVDEAIRHLVVTYAGTAMIVSTRLYDLPVLRSLPALLEPFSVLSPLLSAQWQTAIALVELVHMARPLAAQRRFIAIYERLGQLEPDPDPTTNTYREASRQAIAHGIGRIAADLADDVAFEWAARIDTHPLQRVNAMLVRSATRLMQGDPEAAARYRRDAELLALHASARQMFDHPLPGDLLANVLSRDLARLKHLIGRIEALAARYPGWVPQLRLATGHFELLRGDLEAARVAFEQCRALTAPEQPHARFDVWLDASAGLITTLTEQDRAAGAVLLGEQSLATCHALGVELHWYQVARALALAEAKLARFDSAVARIDAVIEQQRRVAERGLSIGASYEARARIAICARDAASASHYAALALSARGAAAVSAMGTQLERLLHEARGAGLDITLQPTAFEVSVLGATRTRSHDPSAARVSAELAGCQGPEARAERALFLVCDALAAPRGHLFMAVNDNELRHIASRNSAAPDAEITRMARGFFAQQLDERDMSLEFTEADAQPSAACFTDPSGVEQRALLLSYERAGALAYAGVAMLEASSHACPDPTGLLLACRVAAELLANPEQTTERAPTANAEANTRARSKP
jgi:hypothetical protein